MDGIHACKFYTGRPHLLSSLMIEAQKAVNEDKQFIYFAEEDHNDKLRSYFKQIKRINQYKVNQLPETEIAVAREEAADNGAAGFDSAILRFPTGEADFITFYDSQKKIYNTFRDFVCKSNELGYNGVMLCIQMDMVYYSLGEAKLQTLERNIDGAAKDAGVEIICFYDIFKSYKNNIVEKIIDMHEYAIHCSKRYKVDELFG